MTDPGRLDTEAIFAEHLPITVDDDIEVCCFCGETWPCGPVWAAGRVTELRDRRVRREKETPVPLGADDERK